MVRGAFTFLALVVSFPAFAEHSTHWAALLAPALLGVTNRRLDSDYTKLLKLDPRGTVSVHNSVTLGNCTTRFVNSTTAILAAHCLQLESSDGILNVEGVNSIKYFVSDLYPEEISEDIAVVVFPEGTGEFLGIKSYPPLTAEPMERGRAFLIGYGMEDEFMRPGAGKSGVKGWGEFEITGREEGFLRTESGHMGTLFVAPDDPIGKRVAGLGGDSGASVFNEKGEIVGILTRRIVDTKEELAKIPVTFFGFSTGRVVEKKIEVPTGIYNQIVDVTSESSRQVFHKAIRCNESPCAGNFVGSGVSEQDVPVRSESSQAVDKTLFAHRTLRTGRYKGSIEGSADVFIRTFYKGNKINFTELFACKGTGVLPPMFLKCKDNQCVDSIFKLAKLAIDKNDDFLFTATLGHGHPDIENHYKLIPE